jgi:hypothetical protein
MNREVHEEFDWVSERAKCTPAAVFEALRNQVDRDIKIRNLIGPQEGFPKRSFILKEEAGWFAILQRRFPEEEKGAFFMRTPPGIVVRDAESRRDICAASLTLSDEGKCRLKVGDSEYTLWQFRELSLHDLFFIDQEIVL